MELSPLHGMTGTREVQPEVRALPESWTQMRLLLIRPRAVALTVFLGALTAVSRSGFLFAIAYVFKQFDSGQAFSFTDGVLILLSLWVARTVMDYFGVIGQNAAVRACEIRLIEHLLNRLMRLPLTFFERRGVAEVATLVSSDVWNYRMLIVAASEGIVSVLTLAAFAGAAMLIDIELGLIALGTGVLCLVPAFFFGRKILASATAARIEGNRLGDLVNEACLGIRQIKSYGAERKEVEYCRASAHLYLYSQLDRIRYQLRGSNISRGLLGLSLVLTLLYGAHMASQGRMDTGSLVAIVMIFMSASAHLVQVFVVYSSWQQARPSLTHLIALLNEKEESLNENELPAPPATHTKELTVRDATFVYPRETVPALDRVSFTARGGELLVVIGPTGGGKSTLINLLAGLYSPTSGTVALDGAALTDAGLGAWRRRAALATQTPYLFHATLRENLRLGAPDANDAVLEQACANVQATDVIRGLPEGLDTHVGMKGRALSVGQAQRICIARALLKPAPLLLFDEPTSALDAQTETHVLKALRERANEGAIVVVVTHRMGALHLADRILVVSEGRIEASGTAAELEKTSSTWRRLIEAAGATPDHG